MNMTFFYTYNACRILVINPRVLLILFYLRVRSAQQFQALQAQYASFNPQHSFHYPENLTAEAAMAHMASPEATMEQMEPADLTKRTVKTIK